MGFFHLKCIGTSFEDSKCCGTCSEGKVDITPGGDNEEITYPKLEGLSELLQMKGLKVCHQNIRLLLPKIDEVRALIGSHKGIGILGVTESHLSKDISDSEIRLQGYKVYRKDRQCN